MRFTSIVCAVLVLGLSACGGSEGGEATPPPVPADPPAQSAGSLSLVAGALDVDDPASSGSAVGAAASARFRDLGGIAIDAGGNLYLADTGNHCIRKVSAAGQVTTLAGTCAPIGSGFSDGSPAAFSYPADVDIDRQGNLYVTDGWSTALFSVTWNWTSVRKITPAGTVSTLALPVLPGGASNSINGPAIAVNAAAEPVLNFNNVIRRFAPDGTLVANVTAPEVGRVISSLAVDQSGVVYFGYQNTIRKIVPGQAEVVLAGSGTRGYADGRGEGVRFDFEAYPYFQNGFRLRTSMVVDSLGNLYVADTNNYVVRKVAPDGSVTTIAGQAGVRANRLGPLPASLVPQGLALANDKTLYVTTPTAVLRTDLR